MLNEDPKSTILDDASKQKKIDRILAGFKDRFEEGRDDHLRSLYLGRESEGKDPEGTRIETNLGTNPTFTTIRDLTGTSDPAARKARQKMGMGLSGDSWEKGGQILGTIGNDLMQDHSRGLWWLLNAAQATANTVSETVLAKAQPDIYKQVETGIPVVQMDTDPMTGGKVPRYFGKSKKQQQLTEENKQAYNEALAKNIISSDGVIKKNYGTNNGVYTTKKVRPGYGAALLAPTSIAVNAGLGLLNPLGGSGGYTAALPSDDDPTRTANPVLEVAAKYLLGRTGDILPYDEFKEYRPDVTKGEYNAYKAFKYDKNIDLNPFDDGQITLPFGVLKGTMDGIHGTELQFLGRSMPANTTLVPYLGALAGTVAGARGMFRRNRDNVKIVQDGLIGGTGGLAVGAAAGLIAEEMRRRAGSVASENLGAE